MPGQVAVTPWRSMAPLALALAGSCFSFDPLTRAESERLDAFDFYWQRLADDYPLFGDQKIDWNELRSRYRAAVPFAKQPHEFYHLLTGMLSELGDIHVSLRVPPERFAEDGVVTTSLLDVGEFAVMPIEGRLHVISWPLHEEPPAPEGVPAAASYPELWRVNGFPVVLSLVGNLLQGPPESPVELQLRWRNGSVTRHVMHRPRAGTKRSTNLLAHLGGTDTGWITRRREPYTWLELASFDNEDVITQIIAAIDAARETQGLVLDLRRNLGGRWVFAQRLVECFLREPVEMVLVPKHPRSSWFGLWNFEMFVSSTWQPRLPTFDRPLVVLTSALTGSAAEHVARVLQRYTGATVIGERTAGAEAAIQVETGPDGSTLSFGATRVVDRTGVGLQREGVVPDISVRLTLDDLERKGPEEAARSWEQRLLSAALAVFARRAAAADK